MDATTVSVPRRVRIIAYIVGITYAAFLLAASLVFKSLADPNPRWYIALSACSPVVVLILGGLALGHVPSLGGISLNTADADTVSVQAQTPQGATVTAVATKDEATVIPTDTDASDDVPTTVTDAEPPVATGADLAIQQAHAAVQNTISTDPIYAEDGSPAAPVAGATAAQTGDTSGH